MQKTPRSSSAGRPLAAVLGLALALPLAACGSSTTPGSGATTSTVATATAPTGTGSTGTGSTASSASGPTSTASASGGAGAPARKPLRIGFSPFTLQVPALKGLSDALTGIAGAQGDTVLTVDPKGNPSTQLQQMQQWVQLGQVDAIWVIPADAKALLSVVKQAQAKHIVVIASGVPTDYGFSGLQPGTTFTNVDNAAFAGKLGTLTGECITKNLGGKGDVVFLQSAQGSQSGAGINDAFRSALAAAAPASKIVNSQTAKDRLGSQQEVASALQGAPGANVLVGTDDESTLGGLDALTTAGKASGACVLGAGGNDEAKAAVKSRKLFAEVAFNFQADIAQNIAKLHSMAADPAATGAQITTPITVITQ